MIVAALIGIGYWGSKLKRYIEENPNFRLKHICDSKSDLNEVWIDDEVEVIINATPNKFHYEINKVALLNGKHVLSEKPLALRAEECRELKTIAEKGGLVLLTEYTYTFSKALKRAVTMVKEEEIGSLLGMEMSVRHLGRFGGGSVYWLLGSHMLSVLDMFMSLRVLEFERHDLVVKDGNVESGAIPFKGSISGQIIVSLNYPEKETKVILYGEHGTIIYNPMAEYELQVTTYERIPWTVADKLPKETSRHHFNERHNLRYAMETFYNVLRGKREGNLDTAVEITRILESIH